MKPHRIPRLRFVMLMAPLLLFWVILEARMFQIQVIHWEQLSALAELQGRRVKAIEARRGTLVDRHGLPMACSVAMSPGIQRVMNDHGQPLYRRVFPLGSLAGRDIGLLDYRGFGLEGIEARFDGVLKGMDGRIVLPVVGTGEVSPYEPFVIEESPRAGEDLRLTLDIVYQGLAQVEAQLLRDRTHANWTGILIMRPGTGEILASAVAPACDPKEPSPNAATANYLWSRAFEPGSSFKLVTAAAALEYGITEPEALIDCENGTWSSNGRQWHDTHPIGTVTFRDALAHSSNIAAGKLGLEIGAQQFYEMARAFGFGQPTGVDLPAETSGLLRIAARPVSLQAMSMGHELMVTSVQLLNAYCCIGMRGQLIQPNLVGRLSDRGVQSPIVVRQAVSNGTAETMVSLLEGVVEYGTGTRAAHPHIRVAGKTGTAQKAGPGGAGYRPGAYVSTFVGFFPADDPLVALLVIADEPQGKYYAGEICAPAFRSMVDHILTASGGSLYPELAARFSTAPSVHSTVVAVTRHEHGPKA